MKRSQIKVIPNHFTTYTNKIEDIELIDALEKYGRNFLSSERDKLHALGDKVYAPGKWTAKDIIQHLIDCERVFAYRAMRFARNDKTLLPGFEENDYAVTAEASKRDLDELLEEFYVLRDSTIRLFKSFNDEMMHRVGVLPLGEMDVLGLGFSIVGHTFHHMQILKERYYPLI
jgi:DinB superfamily